MQPRSGSKLIIVAQFRYAPPDTHQLNKIFTLWMNGRVRGQRVMGRNTAEGLNIAGRDALSITTASRHCEVADGWSPFLGSAGSIAWVVLPLACARDGYSLLLHGSTVDAVRGAASTSHM